MLAWTNMRVPTKQQETVFKKCRPGSQLQSTLETMETIFFKEVSEKNISIGAGQGPPLICP